MSARLNNNQNEKSQASRFRGGLAFFVFQAVARQRNDLLNVRSIAPTIEAMKYRLWVKPRSALTERLSNNQSTNRTTRSGNNNNNNNSSSNKEVYRLKRTN
ncbi:hypothetical protein NMR64_003467 [Vibrio cholerae]|nr:hypothetical protein [Vibrio cholerae]